MARNTLTLIGLVVFTDGTAKEVEFNTDALLSDFAHDKLPPSVKCVEIVGASWS